MKKYFLLLILFSCRICNAQNLVPNGDFELGPGHSNSIGLGWSVDGPAYWTQTNMTPDYIYYGTPGSIYRDNDSAQSGLAYVIFYGITREAGKATLLQPLQPGTNYFLSYHLDIDDNFNSGPSGVIFKFNGIDSIISPLQLNTGYWEYYDTIFMVTSAATEIEIIGNGNALTKVDNISLTISTAISSNEIAKNTIGIFPNPFSNKINITSTKNENMEIILYDVISKIILQQKFTNSVSLNTEELSKGIYIYEVRNKNGVIKNGKILKY